MFLFYFEKLIKCEIQGSFLCHLLLTWFQNSIQKLFVVCFASITFKKRIHFTSKFGKVFCSTLGSTSQRLKFVHIFVGVFYFKFSGQAVGERGIFWDGHESYPWLVLAYQIAGTIVSSQWWKLCACLNTQTRSLRI